MMEHHPSPKTQSRIQVRLKFRKDRSAWQMSYRNPATGTLVSRLAGSDYCHAASAAENWEAEINQIEWPVRINSRRRRYSHRRPVTSDEFERMIIATPLVVGANCSSTWIDFLHDLWCGMRLQAAFQSHSLKHKFLTMSLANVQRVITQIERAAGIQGGPVTSHEICGCGASPG